MYANKPGMAKQWEADTPKGKKLPMKLDKEDKTDKKKGKFNKKEEKAEKYKGKGTRARLNTAAAKSFFGSKSSK